MLRATVVRAIRSSSQCPGRYLATASPSRDPLLALLLRNPELSPNEAEAELRWIRQDVRSTLQRRAADTFGLAPSPPPFLSLSASRAANPPAKLPSAADVEMLRGMEEGLVLAPVERRAAGEPLQYILGDTDFGPLEILCRAPTLIPRPETAHIVSRLSDELRASRFSATTSKARRSMNVLDLCTGTGCIPLLLSRLLGDDIDQAVGVDISPAAVDLARENASSLGINRVSFGIVDVFASDSIERILELLGTKADVVTCNPPYIPRAEWEQLPDSVREYEDPRALMGDPSDSGDRGLEFYERVCGMLPALMVEEEGNAAPRVMFEVGHDQAGEVAEIMRASGVVKRTTVWQDQYGKERAVVGYTTSDKA